jgi:carboxylesterase type B
MNFTLLELFHKAIALSGSVFCPWAMARQNSSRDLTEVLAGDAGCPTSPSKAMTECLKVVPLQNLLKGYKRIYNSEVE